MTVRLIGAACRNGEQCSPGKPARPVYMSGLCHPCWALGRVIDGIETMECVICGGDPRGGEVQPIFGAGQEDGPGSGHGSLPEPLMFCRECAAMIRARRKAGENAAQDTEAIDSLEVAWRAQFGHEDAA